MPQPPPSPGGSGGRRAWPALIVSGLTLGTGTTDRLQAFLTDYDVVAIDETAEDVWRVFFETAVARDRAAAALRPAFPALSLERIDVADEDWAAKSQQSLRALQVGNIIVAPPWDVPIVLAIQPSMGFGTGHHPTTRLCLTALQRIELSGRTVLDVGTGSGVLAIAAGRLGAGDVTGIDDDADAIHAAWENLALNPGALVSLIVGDFRTAELLPADVIVANLTGALLVSAAERLRRLTKAHGRLVLSGFMADEEQDVLAAYRAFTVEHRGEEEGWVGVTMT
jgi:ribosomal protein L11 methyltransferase